MRVSAGEPSCSQTEVKRYLYIFEQRISNLDNSYIDKHRDSMKTFSSLPTFPYYVLQNSHKTIKSDSAIFLFDKNLNFVYS